MLASNLSRILSSKSPQLGTVFRALSSSYISADSLYMKNYSYLSNTNDAHVRISAGSIRQFSDGGQQTTGEKQQGDSTEPTPSKTDELEAQVKNLNAQIKDLRDQLLRSLAEQDNTRRIAKRDVDAARSFAIASFAKSLLDTSDNLSRAMEAVPSEYRTDIHNHPVLATLYEGIKMTDENLTKAFEKNGLKKFGRVGDKFDPNLHSALFEYPDTSKAAGTIGQVMKIGFTLNERVIRPAEVGVIRNP